MRPDFRMHQGAQGFGLVAAMFLMIVVTLIVIAMARLSAAQHGTNSLSIQQARAYQAARAGLEWGISRALAGTCAVGTPGFEGSGLAEFSVAVACQQQSYTDRDETVTLYRLTATAQNGSPGGRPDYAYRQLTAVVER
jgi:MSHA biogenesis protein MshP